MHATASEPARRGPIALLLRLFSSIWLGVVLLTLLFVYASIGSSGVPVSVWILKPESWVSVREVFELSEFEWFHWWPFDLLIVLICANIIVATLRRIPLNVVNLGVWMIHSGILVLAAGSLWYFGTKVEGDTPVARRQVVAQLDGREPVTFVALPGNVATVGSGADAYRLTVSNITPDWELLSGDDAGDRAYKVSVLVQGPDGMFIRELLAGYPQYTEDLVRSDDPDQPFARAKKVSADGNPIVDDRLELALDFAPQDEFYLMESEALYLRTVEPVAGPHVHRPGDRHCPECNAPLPAAGAGPWHKRTVEGLPRFNDYVASHDHVWFPPGEHAPLRPLDVRVGPEEEGDPLADRTLRITDHLRYATLQSRVGPGGDRFFPIVNVQLRNAAGATQDFELFALDPQRNRVGSGLLEFRWITSEEDLADVGAAEPPVLAIQVPEVGVAFEWPIEALAGENEAFPFTPIDGTPFSFRVRSAQDGLEIGGQTVSLAIVEIDDGTTRWTRWVFQDPSLTRDVPADAALEAHADDKVLDDRIGIRYRPGRSGGGLVLAAGPDEADLRLLVPEAPGTTRTVDLRAGVPAVLRPDDGVSFTVRSLLLRPRSEMRPMIVPAAQRQREVGVQASMIRLAVPAGESTRTAWLPFHIYPFDHPAEKLRRFPYNPTVVHLEDGRHVEILFSRDRMPLPVPVALDAFEVVSHIGGFTGQTSSILDWQSVVRFRDEDAAGGDGAWSEPALVKVNGPTENRGFWFFQSQWDPPDTQPRFEGDPGSNGLNYTVLGVGNRNGVLVQLAGCCIAVIGMIYAFYVKPYIKQRRRLAVYERVAAGEHAAPPGGGAERNGRGRTPAAAGAGVAGRLEESDR